MVEAPGEISRPALMAGIGCYLLWGVMPLLFMALARAGAGEWEILAQRAMWSAPWAGLVVLISGHGEQARAVFARPKVLALLACSTAAIFIGWAVFVWAINSGRNLDASLGYYINPLMNMAVGALLFKERIDRWGAAAIGLAATGVALQTWALGHLPGVSLVLAAAFLIYGLIRRHVTVDAQVGLWVECLLMAGPGLAYVVWLHHSGGGVFLRSGLGTALLFAVGPGTVVPLFLFSWSARRLPLSAVGFLQFIAPTIQFFIGVSTGESLSLLRAASFGVIWAGVAVFAIGLWRAGRRAQQAA